MQVFYARLKSSQRRWAMYLYPLMLVLLEILMRSLLSIEAGSIIGPSLAAVGASFVIPLTVKRPLTIDKLNKLKQRMKQTVYSELVEAYTTGTIYYTDAEEEQVRSMGITFALLLMALWAVALVLTIKPSGSWSPLTVVLGLLSCFIGLLLTEWSEGKI